MILTKCNLTNVKIVCGQNPSECHAADVLQEHIYRIIGVKPEITDKKADGYNILIGEKAELHGDLSVLEHDGYIIKTDANALMLTGKKPHSSLYAVYEFLEKYCDCGFFEDGSRIPEAEKIEFDAIDIKTSPRYRYRMFTTNCTIIYSGMLWWSEEELIEWVDSLAARRMNVWLMEHIVGTSGLLPLVFQSMGYNVEQTEYQKERYPIIKRVIEYCKLCGIEPVTYIPNIGGGNNVDKYTFQMEELQTNEFLKQYNATHDKPFPVNEYIWCDMKRQVLDYREEEARRFIRHYVKVSKEKYGMGNLYQIGCPSEGCFSPELSPEECGKAVFDAFEALVTEIKREDPDAVILSGPPFPYAATYKYQKKAVASQDVVPFDYAVNANRYFMFLMEDYFYGKEWMAGMLTHCSNETNPCGNLQQGIDVMQWISTEPKAQKCIGYIMQNEKCHRRIFLNDGFTKLGWDPMGMSVEGYITDYTLRRYGREYYDVLRPAVKAIADTLYSSRNLGMINTPYYRNLRSIYLPGLTKGSAKKHIGYLPEMRKALEVMLSVADKMEENALFRFDVVDIGRTYLGALFNLYLAGARLGGFTCDKEMLELYSEKTIELMHYIAKFVGSHREFRIQTTYDNCARYPELRKHIPDFNRQSTLLTFTHMLDEFNENLSDYMGEDLAEIIEHYYVPRIRAYLDGIKNAVNEGRRIPTELNTHLPNRRSDAAPPVGELLWSAFGPLYESELMQHDLKLKRMVFHMDLIEDKSLSYDGEITPVLRDMLERYPITDEAQKFFAMDVQEDVTIGNDRDALLDANVGETVSGLMMGIVVEWFEIPQDVIHTFDIVQLSTEYNTLRGEIKRTKITVDSFTKFTRIEDGIREEDGESEKRYTFQMGSDIFLMRIDEGASDRPCTLKVEFSGKGKI